MDFNAEATSRLHAEVFRVFVAEQATLAESPRLESKGRSLPGPLLEH